MTRRQIENTVRQWQQRLRLQHWDIDIDWTKPPREEANATCWRMNQYDRATLFFDPKHIEWTDDFTRKTIVHELLHLHFRDLDRVIGDAEGTISPETFRHIDRRYDHESEGVVDRLATVLVEVGA